MLRAPSSPLCHRWRPLVCAGPAEGMEREPLPLVTAWAWATAPFCRARLCLHVGTHTLLTSSAGSLQASPWTGLSASSVAVAGGCVSVCVCVWTLMHTCILSMTSPNGDSQGEEGELGDPAPISGIQSPLYQLGLLCFAREVLFFLPFH